MAEFVGTTGVRPGRFRDVVDIQQDGSAEGSPTPSYSGAPLYESVPCKIKPISGDESYRGRQLEAHLSAVVEMQYLEGVLPTMRLYVRAGIMAGRTLNIVHVRPLDLDRGRAPKLELYCRELVAV